MTPSDDWERRDLGLGALFLLLGVLVLAFGIGALRNALPLPSVGLALIAGPLLVVLGLNAIVRSIRAGRGPRPPRDGNESAKDRDESRG